MTTLCAALLSRATDIVPHGKWSLHHHLLGTSDILRAWEQPIAIQAAGMLHSIYSTDVFEHQTVALSNRAQMRELAGAEAEWLAYLFSSLKRGDIFEAAAAGKAVRIRARHNDELLSVSQADLGNLVVLHMANLADQIRGNDDRPGPMLSEVSKLGSLARGLATVTPPIFDACTFSVTPKNEADLIAVYDSAFESVGSAESPYAVLTAWTSETGRFVAEPLIIAALLHLAFGEKLFAGSLAKHALELCISWSTSWDKRLSCEQWRKIATFVAAASELDEYRARFIGGRAVRALRASHGSPSVLYTVLEEVGAFNDGSDTFDEAVSISHVTERDAADCTIPPRFAEYLRSLSTSSARDPLLWYPGLRHEPWYDPATIPLAQELARNAEQIIAEVRRLENDEFHQESERIRRSGRWDVLMLLERGIVNEEVATRCPLTMEIIGNGRSILGPAGLAYISRLSAGSKVAPHRGPTNLRLRCHLGIQVPPDCGLRVGATSRSWSESQCLIFDDSFEHEAWNLSRTDRIVLVVDVWHPDLSDVELQLLEALHRQVLNQGQNLLKYWQSNQRSRERSLHEMM